MPPADTTADAAATADSAPESPPPSDPSSPAPRRRPLNGWIILSSTLFSLAIGLFVAWFVIIRPEVAKEPDRVDVSQFLSGSANGATRGATATVERGKHVPNVSFAPLEGSTAITLAGLVGKPMVINFWASSCAPCLREMPLFERMHREYGDRVTFLGVDTSEGAAAGRAMVARTGVTYLQASDPQGEHVVQFGGVQLPHSIVVAADGTVTDVHDRVFDEAALRSSIEAALSAGG